MGLGGRRHASAALRPKNKPVTMIQKAERAPGPVWTDAENFAPPPPPLGSDPRTVHPVAGRYTQS